MELYGSIFTLSGSISSSYFTGSFVGDGSGLYNLPASSVVGLNLSQITTGSISASVSLDGFNVNTDTSITGSLTVNGDTNITGALTASGLIYPINDGLENQVLETDGNGNLIFDDIHTMLEDLYAGENLTKGDPLYVSGSEGAKPIVYKADASDPTKMPVTFIAGETIGANNDTRGIILGLIEGIDLTGFSDGIEVYVAAGGGWSATRPTGSAIVQVLGYVSKGGGPGGKGIVLNSGPSNLPNISINKIWIGDTNSHPIQKTIDEIGLATTSSLTSLSTSIALTDLNQENRLNSIEGVTGSYATTGSNLFIGTQTHSGSILPAVDNAYDLGSSTYQWRDVYISSGSLYVDGTKVLGSTEQELTITTDTGQSIKILEAGSDSIILQSADGDIELKSSGGGDILLDPTTGLISIKGTTQVQDGFKITSSGGNNIVFGDGIIVSGSIDLTGTIDGIDLTQFSSSINQRVESLETSGVVSGSIQIDITGTSGYTNFSSSIATTDLNQENRLNSLETKTGSYATTGSNSFLGSQNITGSLYVSENLTVYGSSSFVYVTSSQLAVSNSYISVNVFEPAERFGGLKVYDSGSESHQATASLLWDSLQNHWIYQNASGSNYSGGMLLSGPRNTGSLGEELGLTSGKIAKSVGGDHLDNSIMNEAGSTIYITGSLSATGTVYGTNINAIETSTGSLNSFTSSINTTIKNKLNNDGVISGSSQISFGSISGIPGGLVSGSSQIDLTATTNYISGIKDRLNNESVISGSGQISSLGFITGYTETDTLASVTARGASTSTRTTFTEVGATRAGSDTVAAGPWFRWTNADESRQMLTQLNASNGLTTWAYNGSAWSSVFTVTQAGAGTFAGNISANNLSGTNTGDQTNITGNAGTVTNGLYTTGDQTITGQKTFPSAIANRPILAGGFISAATGDLNVDLWGISEDYYPSHGTAANAWGIRWSGDTNDIQFVGGGSNRFIFDLDNGNLTAGGTLNGLTVSSGTISSGTWNGTAIGDSYISSASNWNTAYNKRISSASLSSSTLTITLADSTTVTASVPTFNQNTSGNAATATNSSQLGGYSLEGATSVATRIFNNKGQNHNTYTNFNTVMTPGPNYIQGPTNGPTGTAGGQWYGFMFGLGGEYGTSTGTAGHYASQLYYSRISQESNQYLWARDMEGGTWGSWRKLYAGYADTAGNITSYTINQNLGTGNSPTFSGLDLTGRLYLNAGSYEGSILFGSSTTWRCGIRQHDDTDAELRIWTVNNNGMIFLANGYNGEPADIARPTDGLVVGPGNNVGIGNFSSSDPGYKLQVNGTGYFSGNLTTAAYVIVGGSYGNNAYNSVGSTRLLFGGGDSDALSNYFIGTNLENYGGNYTKLDLRWHTGIRMGAQPGYGGIRFFNNEDLDSVLFSIGAGDGNVRSHTNLLPSANNSYNLGSASLGWANVYTNDLHLSNMNKPGGNDIDGTNGTWTIQEGEENLYIINNKNGKRFKIDLTEIV